MAGFASVAKAADVGDGEMASFDVDGTAVAIANVGGQFYAFGNICTHEQCPLADGDLEGTTVTCPCHGSQFDVTNGSVLNPPATEPVPSFALRVEGDAIEVQV